jgi:hypothetical protein
MFKTNFKSLTSPLELALVLTRDVRHYAFTFAINQDKEWLLVGLVESDEITQVSTRLTHATLFIILKIFTFLVHFYIQLKMSYKNIDDQQITEALGDITQVCSRYIICASLVHYLRFLVTKRYANGCN